MWNKKIILAIAVFLFVFNGTGCRTTSSNSERITELAVASEHSITRIEFVNQELSRISERERRVISDLQSGSRSLEEIINELFGISFRLLDEIDYLREQLGYYEEMGD